VLSVKPPTVKLPAAIDGEITGGTLHRGPIVSPSGSPSNSNRRDCKSAPSNLTVRSGAMSHHPASQLDAGSQQPGFRCSHRDPSRTAISLIGNSSMGVVKLSG
jgi:hypothetical protein